MEEIKNTNTTRTLELRTIGIATISYGSILTAISLVMIISVVIFQMDMEQFKFHIYHISYIIEISYSFLFLISGIGILKRKSWGKNLFLSLIFVAIFPFVLLWVILISTENIRLTQVITEHWLTFFIIAFYLKIVRYFNSPKIREQFKMNNKLTS